MIFGVEQPVPVPDAEVVGLVDRAFAGVSPLLALGTFIVVMAIIAARTADKLFAREGWWDRRSNALIEDKKAQRAHEQELQKERLANENRIVDQVLTQTGQQVEQLTQQSGKDREQLFKVFTEQVGSLQTQTSSVAATSTRSTEQLESVLRVLNTIQIGLAKQDALEEVKPPLKPRPE